MIGSRYVRFPSGARNEREYEIRREIKREHDDIDFSRKLELFPDETEKMAAIVDRAGGDPREFLTLLKFDADAFDLEPSDVYDGDLDPDREWLYDFDLDEVEQLHALSCAAYEQATDAGDIADETVARLEDLCELLDVAVEVGIPPQLSQW